MVPRATTARSTPTKKWLHSAMSSMGPSGCGARVCAATRAVFATSAAAASAPRSRRVRSSAISPRQEIPQFVHADALAHIKRAEQRVHGADLIEAHLVDELLEHQRIVGKQIHAPLPIVEPDRARDNLLHRARVAPSDGSMVLHHALAVLHAHLVPVFVLAALSIHRVKADILGLRNLGIQARPHRLPLAL